MRKNLWNWHAFATDSLGVDLQESDIIFISGLVNTAAWEEVAFSSKSSDAELFLSGGLLLPLGSTVSGSLSATLLKCVHPSIFHRWGPPARAVAVTSEPEDGSVAHPKPDQSIFVSYFKTKSRLFPRVLRAAAGAHELPQGPASDGTDSPSMLANISSWQECLEDLPDAREVGILYIYLSTEKLTFCRMQILSVKSWIIYSR